ncbi:uncharacterized protein N7473_001347 [Penicillium subrubescens]|uniref:uncharacterized protein n=1 Tax=Penicillium subrubescens TaxID=1316194 RepID=UPI00254530B4|nr:uncharacterized protein N7473_001347 [Penicillium subrubescens]KAJ5912044.1 hypothetical protein N7473_001347 [Penicillium subrubescens]
MAWSQHVSSIVTCPTQHILTLCLFHHDMLSSQHALAPKTYRTTFPSYLDALQSKHRGPSTTSHGDLAWFLSGQASRSWNSSLHVRTNPKEDWIRLPTHTTTLPYR